MHIRSNDVCINNTFVWPRCCICSLLVLNVQSLLGIQCDRKNHDFFNYSLAVTFNLKQWVNCSFSSLLLFSFIFFSLPIFDLKKWPHKFFSCKRVLFMEIYSSDFCFYCCGTFFLFGVFFGFAQMESRIKIYITLKCHFGNRQKNK